MTNHQNPIPGNRYSELGTIYIETTVEYLQDRLTKLVSAQSASMRSNPRYRTEKRRIERAIARRTA